MVRDKLTTSSIVNEQVQISTSKLLKSSATKLSVGGTATTRRGNVDNGKGVVEAAIIVFMREGSKQQWIEGTKKKIDIFYIYKWYLRSQNEYSLGHIHNWNLRVDMF